MQSKIEMMAVGIFSLLVANAAAFVIRARIFDG